jgi:hypothetical protein
LSLRGRSGMSDVTRLIRRHVRTVGVIIGRQACRFLFLPFVLKLPRHRSPLASRPEAEAGYFAPLHGLLDVADPGGHSLGVRTTQMVACWCCRWFRDCPSRGYIRPWLDAIKLTSAVPIELPWMLARVDHRERASATVAPLEEFERFQAST